MIAKEKLQRAAAQVRESDTMVTLLNQYGRDITSCYLYQLDRMVVQKAFLKVLTLWPEKIDVCEQKTTFISDIDKSHTYIPNLSKVWDDVEIISESYEENIDGLYSDDVSTSEYLGMVTWIICCVLHDKAIGKKEVFPRDVTFQDIERRVIRGYLGWKHQRPDNVRDDSVITIEWQTGKILSIKNP